MIFAADDLRGDCKEREGDFLLAVSPHLVADIVSHMHLQSYPPHVGSHRQPRQRRGSRPQGGQPLTISRGYEYVYGHPAQKMRYAIPVSLAKCRTRLGIVLRPIT